MEPHPQSDPPSQARQHWSVHRYMGNVSNPGPGNRPEPAPRRGVGTTLTAVLTVLVMLNAVVGTMGALRVRPAGPDRPVVLAGHASLTPGITAVAPPAAVVTRTGTAVGVAVPAPSPLRTLVPPLSPQGAPLVALTFDDGPDPRWTPAILQILREEGVVATFCTVGTLAAAHPDLIRAQAAQGHASCDHTVHHDNHLDRRLPPVIAGEINGQADILKSITGTDPRYFRAPGGNLSAPMVEMAHARAMRALHWSADVPEFRGASAAHMLPRLLAFIRPGTVVLLHDGGGDRSAAVAMVRPLIHHLKARGFAFTLP